MSALPDEQRRLEARQTKTRLNRPDIAHVQALWGRFLKLCEKATEEERCQLLPVSVERVELTEKERGFCDLAFQTENPRSLTASSDGKVLVNFAQGAAAVTTTTFSPRVYDMPLFMPVGGRNRNYPELSAEMATPIEQKSERHGADKKSGDPVRMRSLLSLCAFDSSCLQYSREDIHHINVV